MNVLRAAEHHNVMTAIGKPKPVREKKQKRTRSKSERKMLEARLWKLTADIVKARDGCCVTCLATEGLTLSHWIKCGKQIVRYDLRNCNCQCSTCNGTHNRYSYFYDNYMTRRWGQDVMLELTNLAIAYDSNNFKWTVLQLREMVADYENKLAEFDATCFVSKMPLN